MQISSFIVGVEILNLEGEWCYFDVSISSTGLLIDRHPDEVQLYPSIFVVNKQGRWQDEFQRLTTSNAKKALKLDSPYVRLANKLNKEKD